MQARRWRSLGARARPPRSETHSMWKTSVSACANATASTPVPKSGRTTGSARGAGAVSGVLAQLLRLTVASPLQSERSFL